MKIGVLCLQGAVSEHGDALASCGADVEYVKTKEQLKGIDGLIIPGGESTTIGKLIERFGLTEPIREMAAAGTPVYGTCAGLILLSRAIPGSDQFLLGLMDTTVSRNAFGRQRESFEADLDIPVLGQEPYRAVFIRAPQILEHGPEVQVLAAHNGSPVAARQGNLLVTSFHPELTDDNRMHCYFLEMIKEFKDSK
jgi:pyridoxal 5'-phosphate synthase pdxT subunit